MPLHQTGDGSDFIADSVNYITETCFLCEKMFSLYVCLRHTSSVYCEQCFLHCKFFF